MNSAGSGAAAGAAASGAGAGTTSTLATAGVTETSFDSVMVTEEGAEEGAAGASTITTAEGATEEADALVSITLIVLVSVATLVTCSGVTVTSTAEGAFAASGVGATVTSTAAAGAIGTGADTVTDAAAEAAEAAGAASLTFFSEQLSPSMRTRFARSSVLMNVVTRPACIALRWHSAYRAVSWSRCSGATPARSRAPIESARLQTFNTCW